jgi:DNA polymerase-3 subunit epsilon
LSDAFRGDTLVERARAWLQSGPAHTLDLARGAFALTGPPGAVSAAVFTLLGADRRFRVDSAGVWSVTGVPTGPSLHDVACAVVDVETTGGSFGDGHGIIEIAIVHVRGGQVEDVWHTLVNPGRWLPSGVQHLTGITEEMLRAAPYFDHVALEVSDRLEGRVFVAHNAAFDWRFVSAELARAVGAVPVVPRLCTLRMTRRLVPGLRRRNLDALSQHFAVPNHARHRADGDALVTARIFARLLEAARDQGLRDLHGLEQFLGGGSAGRKRGRPRARRGLA